MLDVRGHQWLYFLVYLLTFLRADASPDVPITIIHDAVKAGAGVSLIAYRSLSSFSNDFHHIEASVCSLYMHEN